MNRDQIKGSWAVLKGKAKLAWGELTSDERLKGEGSADKIYGTVQKKLGDTKEAIKAKLDRIRLP